MTTNIWIAFVAGAVISWGVYVPVLHEGQSKMGGPGPDGGPSAGAVRAFLCVGIAYFVTAVIIPLIALQFGLAGTESLNFNTKEGLLNTRALVFSTLGGVAGAAGALCIIFAIKNGGKPLWVAPLVFAGAPIVNAIVSMLWHPPEELGKSEYTPGWIMFAAGILLAAAGAGLVLYSKGFIDQKTRDLKQTKAKMAALVAMSKEPPPSAAPSSTGIKPKPDSGIQGTGNG
ncbi:MAG: hypothetical protein EXR98_14815 [Gemmataceae bacterium]|nr:hypothetical protein [Gemmataceae bacterium]